MEGNDRGFIWDTVSAFALAYCAKLQKSNLGYHVFGRTFKPWISLTGSRKHYFVTFIQLQILCCFERDAMILNDD